MKILKVIKNYNKKVLSLSKTKYSIVVVCTIILETVATSVIPSMMNGNYDSIIIKMLVIFPVLCLFQVPAYYNQYKKFNYTKRRKKKNTSKTEEC